MRHRTIVAASPLILAIKTGKSQINESTCLSYFRLKSSPLNMITWCAMECKYCMSAYFPVISNITIPLISKVYSLAIPGFVLYFGFDRWFDFECLEIIAHNIWDDLMLPVYFWVCAFLEIMLKSCLGILHLAFIESMMSHNSAIKKN